MSVEGARPLISEQRLRHNCEGVGNTPRIACACVCVSEETERGMELSRQVKYWSFEEIKGLSSFPIISWRQRDIVERGPEYNKSTVQQQKKNKKTNC